MAESQDATNPSDNMIFTKPGLKELMKKASVQTEGPHSCYGLCEQLYRNDTKEYFDEIEQNGQVMPIKEKEKDKTAYGDKCSPINCPDSNKRPKGVFFCANVDSNNDPVPTSPFGNRRFLIDIGEVITDDVNMYFADFYCCHGGQQTTSSGKPVRHYVTIILAHKTKPESCDAKCGEYLVELAKDNNPFLRRVESGWEVSKNAFIEVFVTWNITGIDNKTIKQMEGKSSGQRPHRPGYKGLCIICSLPSKDEKPEFYCEDPNLSFQPASSPRDGTDESVSGVTGGMDEMSVSEKKEDAKPKPKSGKKESSKKSSK